ncbi:MAG: hypothetical protein EOP83_08125 [Verrucomicrobiaceae bacterium]|nr:MAG: hypothetical protein EOP83_08125 [Verrucomicrobiaceae bacterium]
MNGLALYLYASIGSSILLSGIAVWLMNHEGDAGPGSYTDSDHSRLDFALSLALTGLAIHLIETSIYIGQGKLDG